MHTPSMHHPRGRNVTTFMVGLKQTTVTYAKISPKTVNPREMAENGEEEEKEELRASDTTGVVHQHISSAVLHLNYVNIILLLSSD